MTNTFGLRRLACIAAAGLIMLTGACGDDDDDGGDDADTTTTIGVTTTAAAAAAANTVTIKNFQFTALTAKGGTAITVKNDDTVPHTYTADDGKFDTKNIAPGSTASFTLPSEAGAYKVHCNIHSSMTGTATAT